MIVGGSVLNDWESKGHCYGECMSSPNSDLMYVYIPKNASSWTKPNLQDFGWEFYNYHHDKINKHAIVVLRDPLDRWLSGIAEYLTLYHPDFELKSSETIELIFDRLTFDDHTERQVKFISGLDTNNCTFFYCDDSYRHNFSKFFEERYGPNSYFKYDYQHVSENSPERRKFKSIFGKLISENQQYYYKIKNYFKHDYELIDQVKFYDAR